MDYIKKIVQIPDPALTNKNKPSLPVIGALWEKQLIETLVNHGTGVGLAAPQIGLNRKLCVVKLNNGTSEETIICLHNPVLIPTSEEKISIYEGCLSIPNKRVAVERFNEVSVSYENKWGKKQALLDLQGFDAIIVQHEYDHLNGTLITDYNQGITEEEYAELMKQEESEQTPAE